MQHTRIVEQHQLAGRQLEHNLLAFALEYFGIMAIGRVKLAQRVIIVGLESHGFVIRHTDLFQQLVITNNVIDLTINAIEILGDGGAFGFKMGMRAVKFGISQLVNDGFSQSLFIGVAGF